MQNKTASIFSIVLLSPNGTNLAFRPFKTGVFSMIYSLMSKLDNRIEKDIQRLAPSLVLFTDMLQSNLYLKMQEGLRFWILFLKK